MSDPIRAILFDLGDTLIHYGEVDRTALFKSAARRTYQLWAGRQRRMPGYRRYYLHQWFAMHWGYLKQRLLRREISAMRYLRRACRKLWLQADEHFYDELAWAWYQPLAEVATLEPDTHQTLHRLADAGYRLGIVSNTFVPGFVLDRHLRKLDLLRFFPVRVYSCDVQYRKPDPRIFHIALRRLGITPEQAVFVGDSYDADVRGSESAGLIPVWKTTAPVCGDLNRAGSLSELPRVIRRLKTFRRDLRLAV